MSLSALNTVDSEKFNSGEAAESLAAILPRVLQRHGLDTASVNELPPDNGSHVSPLRDTAPSDVQSSRVPSGCSKYRVKLRTRCT